MTFCFHKAIYKNFLEKMTWALAPVVWGAFTWFMAWGWGNTLIPHYQLNLLIRVIVVSVLIIIFFGKALGYAQKHYIPLFLVKNLKYVLGGL